MPNLNGDSPRNDRPNALVAFGTLAILGAAIVISVQNLTSLSEQDRHSASNEAELSLSKRQPAEAFRKTEGVILSELVPLTDLEGPKARFKGIARTRIALSELHYSWTPSPQLRVIQGASQGLVTDVKADQISEFEVEVEAIGPGPHRLVFKAWRIKNGEPMGNTASIRFGRSDPGALQSLKQSAPEVPPAPRSPEEFRRRAIQ